MYVCIYIHMHIHTHTHKTRYKYYIYIYIYINMCTRTAKRCFHVHTQLALSPSSSGPLCLSPFGQLCCCPKALTTCAPNPKHWTHWTKPCMRMSWASSDRDGQLTPGSRTGLRVAGAWVRNISRAIPQQTLRLNGNRCAFFGLTAMQLYEYDPSETTCQRRLYQSYTRCSRLGVGSICLLQVSALVTCSQQRRTYGV